MNRKKEQMSGLLHKSVIMGFILLIIPFTLFAKGGKDSEYEGELKTLTERICTSVEAREMNAVQAKNLLGELRTKYRKEYTDESGKMDSIIDALAGGEMNAEQARNQFRILEQARLQERDKEQTRLREQERTQTRDQTQDQNQDQTQTREQLRDQTQTQEQTQSKDKSGDGGGSGK